MSDDTRAIVDAVNDLTRVTLAVHGNFASKAEAIRRLDELAIPVGRIAAIMAIPSKDVSSVLARQRKQKKESSADA